MHLGHRSTHAVLASAIATLAAASLASAQERAGVITTLEGKVTVVRASSPELTPLKFRDAIFVRDRIATGKDSFARILLGGKAVVTVREFSAVTITEVPGVATVDVGSGRVAVAVARERMRPGDLVEVRTPNAVAGIRGTVIVAEVFDARHSVITVLKGVIDVTRLDAGRAAGPATILNALQQVTITGPNPVSAPQPISVDAAQKMGADFRSAPPRGAPSATTAAVSQGEVERAAKDMAVAIAAPSSTASASAASSDSAPAKDKSAQSDQSGGDSDKGKSNPSGTAAVSTSGAAASSTSSSASGSSASTSTTSSGSAGSASSTAATSGAAATSSAPATAAPAPAAAASASSAPVASAPATSNAPATAAPVASAPVVASTPAASAPVASAVPAASAPVVSASPAPSATPAATPTPSAPLFVPPGLANSTGLGNGLGNVKADKAEKDNGKSKNR